jgi:subtilisin family serine protease
MPEIGYPPDFKKHDDVVFAQADRPPFMWHRPQSLLDTLKKWNITGKGLRIGIIDDGYTPHPWLPKPVEVRNFTSSRTADSIGNHGEHVFGMIGGLMGIGLLPEADYFIAKGLGDNGSGQSNWLNACIRWCADNECHFINGSYGSSFADTGSRDAINYFYEKGGLLAHFAAGNGSYNGVNNSIIYPAKWDLGSTNGSYDADGTRSSFSAGGIQLDVLGAGGRVISTVSPRRDNPQPVAAFSGTSMGSPDNCTMSGAYTQRRRQVGLPDLKGPREWGNEYASLFERKAIKDGGAPGRDNYYGWGQFEKEAMIEGIEEPVGS